MSVPLILFFASLLGISLMIGKKLVLLKNGPITAEEKNLAQFPDLREIRYIAIKNTKKYGYIILVAVFRFSIRSSKLLKHKYKGVKNAARNLIKKYSGHKRVIGEKEVSGFLKKISEYKNKIRQIKNQVIEEEKEK